MKNKWSNYALKDGKIQSSYIREYCNRKKIRKAREASNCNSNEQSWEKQSKAKEKGEINENIREENTSKAYKEGRQGIQESDQRRCEIEERNHEIQTREEEKINGQENSHSKGKRRVSKRSKKSS